MPSPPSPSRDPLHGITLESIVNQLVEKYGWKEMARRIPIRCFRLDPTVKSSLTFLRKTPWAREKVEDWFIGEVLRKRNVVPKPPTSDVQVPEKLPESAHEP
jgi:uncharacterized protein (DUF2132 family)